MMQPLRNMIYKHGFPDITHIVNLFLALTVQISKLEIYKSDAVIKKTDVKNFLI